MSHKIEEFFRTSSSGGGTTMGGSAGIDIGGIMFSPINDTYLIIGDREYLKVGSLVEDDGVRMLEKETIIGSGRASQILSTRA